MSLKIARKAIEFANDYDGAITIGGGEPTLHPYFWTIIGECLGLSNVENLWMATNGSQTNTSLRLADMAKKGIIGVALSQDRWHDEIDERVIEAFNSDKGQNGFIDKHHDDLREIRTVSSLSNVGRAKRNHLATFTDKTGDHCCCDDWFINPNGDLKQCGCPDAPVIGNLLIHSFKELFKKMEKVMKDCGQDERQCFQVKVSEKELMEA
jgi:MoaA/NifB/PqqE/SkfB family radical SAM enzyme